MTDHAASLPAASLPAAGPAPLILTLTLDDDAQARFDGLRRRHFPPERNHLAAHVTLFHALPDTAAVRADVRDAAERRAPFPVAVTGLRSLGRGVAYVLAAPDLTELRRDLAYGWEHLLTQQDRQRHAPHVTVQNKVTPEAARALLADLGAGFAPHTVTGTGLALWRYLGGPWEPVDRYPFTG